MTRLPLRTMIVLVCLGVIALISITVQQTFSKSLATPRVSSSLAGASTPIHAKSLMTPRVSNALQVAAGEGHTCAIQTNGSVKCWGANWVGQLGYGDSTDRGDNAGEMGTDLPIVDLGTNHTATQISSGFAHTCVILDDGTLKCWGYNNYGQLGVGDKVNHGNDTNQMGEHLPIINLGTGKTALAVSAGKYHTCAILNDHTLKCWGNGANGQLGYVDNLSLDTPSDNPVDLGNNRTISAAAIPPKQFMYQRISVPFSMMIASSVGGIMTMVNSATVTPIIVGTPKFTKSTSKWAIIYQPSTSAPISQRNQ